ncbi:OmpA family protein [Chitinophaga sp. sic0106]|uniref:OmpA family protein n=1 Tax=Chitinophaga sp. sic0106 TaxID=2854785 RepID=UPI001C489D13|nr:OmpA family protein [Chitinophaga sp. sic0106]MBV7531484.1 OmpA family protein [Chitinophaga sp. sic0106]
MSFDLLESAKNLFNGNVISQASAQLGESEGGIQKALSGIIPTVLTGLLHKTEGSGDVGGLLNLVKGAASDASPAALGSALQGGAGTLLSKGADLLRSLFGDKVGAIATTLAGYAGIKESSATTLLQSAAPATLGTVGQYAIQNNLNAGGFAAFLNSQKDKILNAVPGGVNLAGILGLGSLSAIGSKLSGLAGSLGSAASGAATSTVNTVKQAGNGKWIWSLLLILVAIILLWYLMRGCGGNKNNEVVTDSITTAQLADSALSPAPVATEMVRESIQVSLPDGTVLNAYKGGIEDQLVNFLKDGSKQAGKDVWFDFDNLNFKTGSAEIMEESKVQLSNLAAILKAFPKTKIKVGGYTDKTGDAAINKKLSQDRADAVVNGLKNLNTDAAQLLGAEGYGAEFAKAAADAPDEERKKDRHISVSVREK